MDLEATLRSLSGLADASTRAATLDTLAQQLGACAVRLAVEDVELARFTPPPDTPGWPESSSWNDMLERCRRPGTHTGTLTSPREGAPAPAVAYAAPRLSLIVVGHTQQSDQLARAFELVAPLLAALLRAEQQAAATRRQVLARVAQELRDPIAPIANALQLLRLDGVQSRVHEILERQVMRLVRTLDDVIAEGEQHVAPPPRATGIQPGTPSPAGPRRATVLVVDDNRDAADLLATLLGSLGYAVRVAHTGPDGLALLDEITPDIGLLDIGLPGMDGYELARALHERLPDLPLVAITGYGQDKDRARAFDAGFTAHLVKPVSIASLSDVLAELVHGRR